jgi:hypothetical protein
MRKKLVALFEKNLQRQRETQPSMVVLVIDEPSRCIIALVQKCMHEAKIVVAETTLVCEL